MSDITTVYHVFYVNLTRSV